MTTTTDTSLNTLIINQLTAEQYNSITPVENQIYLVEEEYTVEEKINAALQPYSPTEDFANVAFSGEYSDLLNAPTIPAAQMQSDWAQTNSLSPDYIVNKPTLATVATTGEYSDLLNTPTIVTPVQSDWAQTDTSALDYIINKPTLATIATSGEWSDIVNKPTFATVATSGEYSDLLNTPTIPVVEQVYNASSANAMSGVAVANAIDQYATKVVFRTYTD